MKMAYLINRRVPLAVVQWHPAMLFALGVIDAVFYAYTGEDALMTGAQEAAHGKGSRHYGRMRSVDPDIRCQAADFSTKKIKENWVEAMNQELRKGLGVHFDVVWERHKSSRKSGLLHHLHIEYDPEQVRTPQLAR